MRFAAICLIAAAAPVACAAPADEPSSIPYRLFVIDETQDLTVRIEGVVENPYERPFDDLAALEAESIDVELAAGDLVVDRLVLPSGLDCEGQIVEGVSEDACATPWGELRWGSTTLVTADGGGCHFDGFCTGACDPGAEHLCVGAKCGISRPTLDGAWSKVECVAAGAVPVGESCSWTARDDGRFVDDCVRDALCIDGTCVALCAPGAPIAGMPQEIQACASP